MPKSFELCLGRLDFQCNFFACCFEGLRCGDAQDEVDNNDDVMFLPTLYNPTLWGGSTAFSRRVRLALAGKLPYEMY